MSARVVFPLPDRGVVGAADRRHGRIDIGPDRGAAREEERQQGKGLVVRCRRQLGDPPQPFVQKPVGERTQALPRQVHQGEGEVVEDVDVGDLVGEFDGIERHGLSGQQHDVAQMEVAVAAPHRPGRLPPRHQIRPRLERPWHRHGQRLAGRRIEALAGLAHLAHIGGDRMPVVVGPAEARGNGRQAIMKAGDARAQRRHQFRCQRAARGHAVEQTILVKATHDDHPVDRVVARLARIAQDEGAIAAPPDRRNPEIDFGRELTVDVDLGGTHDGAPARSREIHVGELHRALQLVGAFARKKHDRAMGVDAARRCQPGTEKVDDLRLIFYDKGWTGGHGFKRTRPVAPRRRRDRREG